LPVGAIRDEIVELADFCPTLLDAVGVGHDAPMDGRSFAAGLCGQATESVRDHAYIESFAGSPGDPTPAPKGWARTIRDRRWRCTFYPEAGCGELFDLESDPHELNNLWFEPKSRETIEWCREILLRRLILMDFPLKPKSWMV
jgi:arylsulfatase A-like enzyme